MVQKFLSIVTISTLLVTCNNNNGKNENKQPAADTSATVRKSQDIPFIAARNYFVKNTVKQGGLENHKIETRENFDSIFGAATTMNNRKPTEIDCNCCGG